MVHFPWKVQFSRLSFRSAASRRVVSAAKGKKMLLVIHMKCKTAKKEKRTKGAMHVVVLQIQLA